MKITFNSSFTDTTNNYYLKQQLPTCEVRLNQILAINPRLIYCLNRYSNVPFIGKNTHHDIIFLNESNLESLSKTVSSNL